MPICDLSRSDAWANSAELAYGSVQPLTQPAAGEAPMGDGLGAPVGGGGPDVGGVVGAVAVVGIGVGVGAGVNGREVAGAPDGCDVVIGDGF